MPDATTGFLASRAGASLMLVAVMLVWGASVPVSKAAVAEVPPLLLVWLRFAIAALLLWPAYRARRRAGASAIALRPALGLGLTGIALYGAGDPVVARTQFVMFLGDPSTGVALPTGL